VHACADRQQKVGRDLIDCHSLSVANSPVCKMSASGGAAAAAVSNTNPHEQYEESFVDHNWVQLYGLDEHKVLAYFSCSQFYDRRCNNETLTMQGKDLSFLK
jgi:hypothetical protein